MQDLEPTVLSAPNESIPESISIARSFCLPTGISIIHTIASIFVPRRFVDARAKIFSARCYGDSAKRAGRVVSFPALIKCSKHAYIKE